MEFFCLLVCSIRIPVLLLEPQLKYSLSCLIGCPRCVRVSKSDFMKTAKKTLFDPNPPEAGCFPRQSSKGFFQFDYPNLGFSLFVW